MRTFIRRTQAIPRVRLALLAGIVVALAGAAVAAAHFNGSAASSVSATFYANTVSGTTTSSTCTTPTTSNAITVTDATFTGTSTSTSDPSLNGPLTIHVRSVYDSTTNLGSVTADYVVDNSTASTPTWFGGELTAVDNNGTLQGLLLGSQSGGNVVANVTSAFSASAGFASSSAQGTIGGNGSASDSGIMTSNPCSSMGTGAQGGKGPQGFQGFPSHPATGQGNGNGFSFGRTSDHGHHGHQD
jgi:hypothetical protein